jgi:uncharacterized protein
VTQFCVILTGMLPGHQDRPDAWHAVVANAYGQNDEEFGRRVSARMPLIVKRNLDQSQAEQIAASLSELGADVRIAADDGQSVYLQRDSRTMGPIPWRSISDFARMGDAYRLQNEVEWQSWGDPASSEMPPSLPGEAQDLPPPFAAVHASATASPIEEPPPLPGVASKPSYASPDASNNANVPPPPFLVEAPIMRTPPAAAAQRPMPAKKSNVAMVTMAIVGGVVVAIGLAGAGTYLYMHRAAAPAPVVASQPASAPLPLAPPSTTPASRINQAPPAVASVAPGPSSPSPSSSSLANTGTSIAPATPAVVATATAPRVSSVKPSFDCAKAQTPTEQAICGSDDLSGLDSQMAQAYRHTMAKMPSDQLASFKASQRQWLQERADKCGGDDACIQSILQARIDELHGMERDAQASASMQASSEAQGKLEAASECFQNANYDCSIQIARTLLTQNPNDARAQDLLRRAQAAQNQALHSSWNVH